MKVNSNKDNFQNNCLVVFQLFNGWLDACMNYLYRISSDTGTIWRVEECHNAEEICPFQSIHGIGNVKLETMCLDSLIEHTFSR
jgi:hypothetical protein